MSSDGVRPAVGVRTGLPRGHSAWLALTVLWLIAGVVAMHSLGTGHPPTSMATPGQATGSAHAAHSVAAVPEPGPFVMSCPACLVAGPVPAGAPSHDMGAACLAILPMLLLFLRRRFDGRSVALARARSGRPALFVASGRGPPGCLRPSLPKLCVLRI